ncbi:MAG TPA: NAD(P)H-hydrate dehydratase [Croceibacterium sp.]|nr:NAD(P)H-hydrate dehydratase [Croceibacterium sp.]
MTLQNEILTAAQMRAAEDAAVARGISVGELMQRAGEGAADWVWRISAGHPVTVLCGPGNNGGDGYVLAEAIRRRGGAVRVVAAMEPATDAAKAARAAYRGEIAGPEGCQGAVLVDCLFGTGLSRPLAAGLVALLADLAKAHHHAVAVDLPSGVATDTGEVLQPGLPRFDATLALGAWKPAHWLMPAMALMGERRLVEIGIGPTSRDAMLLERPRLAAPRRDAHKYTRGLVLVIAGKLPGASLMACEGAMRAGAGAVRLAGTLPPSLPPDVIVRGEPLAVQLADERTGAVLVGPGLGTGDDARQCLGEVLGAGRATVIDADALTLLDPQVLKGNGAPRILTPHDGEMSRLLNSFNLEDDIKPQRAAALAKAARSVVIAKGPDTVIAAPDGRLAYAPSPTSWLSVAGTGDVLAGIAASRLAATGDPFRAACEGVWLHGEAARLAGPAFLASDLAARVSAAVAAAL